MRNKEIIAAAKRWEKDLAGLEKHLQSYQKRMNKRFDKMIAITDKIEKGISKRIDKTREISKKIDKIIGSINEK